MIRHVLRSVIVPHREAARDALGEPAEAPAHALPDWFQRLEPGCPRMGVDADALGGAMIDRDEHRRRALAGERRRQIGPPHRVHRLGDDGAVMVPRPMRRADPPQAQQIILAHQPKHPPQRGPDFDPDYAVAYAMTIWCHASQVGFGLVEDIKRERSEVTRLWRIVVRVGQEDAVALSQAAYRRHTPIFSWTDTTRPWLWSSRCSGTVRINIRRTAIGPSSKARARFSRSHMHTPVTAAQIGFNAAMITPDSKGSAASRRSPTAVPDGATSPRDRP